MATNLERGDGMLMPTATWNMPLSGMRLLFIQEYPEELVIGLETNSGSVECPRCHSSETVGYGRMNVRVRDLPVGNRKVFLDVKRRRLRCQACSKTFNEPIAKISENHRATVRLVKSIWKMALRMPFMVLSKELGMDDKTVRTIFKDLLEGLKNMPHFEAVETVLLWRPIILRVQRSIWVNKDEGTLLSMQPDAKPATIQEGLKQILTAGIKTIFVPPDTAIIKLLRESTEAALILHGMSLKAECARAVEGIRPTKETVLYSAAVSEFIRSETECEAQLRWPDLLNPPPGLRSRMRPIITAVEHIGDAAFEDIRGHQDACDAQVMHLEQLLAADFSRRSYDVIHAIMMLDKHLHKTKRIPAGAGTENSVLDYRKVNYGTSIPKLLGRLKSMAKEAKEI